MIATLEQLPRWAAFDAGLLLLAVAQVFFALVLRELLTIIKRRGIWLLPLFGTVLSFGAIAIHLLTHTVYLPRLDLMTDVASAEKLILLAYKMRLSCFALLFLSGLLTCVSGFAYLRWINK